MTVTGSVITGQYGRMPSDGSIQLVNEFVVPEGMATRAARAFFRFGWSRPRLLLIAAGGLVVIVAVSLLTGFGDWRLSILSAVLAYAVAMSIAVALNFRKTARAMARAYTPGAVLASGFGDHSLALEGPLNSSVVRYEAYESAVERDGFVIIKQRDVALYFVLPAELFPDASLDLVRAGIAAGA